MVEEILYEHGLNYYNGNYGVNKKVICNLVDNNMSIVTGETKLSDYVMIEKNATETHEGLRPIGD